MSYKDNKKPLVFFPVRGTPHELMPDIMRQSIILKGLTEGITSPKELAKLAGMKKASDVYVALDKMALRKDFHLALAKNGITLDYIVGKLKGICESPSDTLRLKALSTLLKSIGLERYEETEISVRAWEDVVLEAATENGGEMEQLGDGSVEEEDEYDVTQPIVPEEMIGKHEREMREGRKLYEE